MSRDSDTLRNRGQARRVLVIDDEEPVADLISDVLRRHGYSVDVSSGGEAALQVAIGGDYGLVISDFALQEAAPPPKVTHYNCPGCRTPLAPELETCSECGFKLNQVRAMSKTLEIRTDTLERRTKPRRLTNIPCLYTSDSLTFEAHARDVSRGGLFIATELVDHAGTPCAVTLLPDGKPPYTLVGVVSRGVDRDEGPGGLPRGMGIRFSQAGAPR